MSAIVSLRPADRKALLRHYRGSPVPAVRLRCHILLLLDAGRPWVLIAAVLFTSSAAINRWRRAYLRGGIDAVLAGTPGRRPCLPGTKSENRYNRAPFLVDGTERQPLTGPRNKG